VVPEPNIERYVYSATDGEWIRWGKYEGKVEHLRQCQAKYDELEEQFEALRGEVRRAQASIALEFYAGSRSKTAEILREALNPATTDMGDVIADDHHHERHQPPSSPANEPLDLGATLVAADADLAAGRAQPASEVFAELGLDDDDQSPAKERQ
jgi:hypothetical protein